jgi:NADPH:quinone reductase-like Zn-dependent oxidoreductase
VYAAVLHEYDTAPRYEQFADPAPGPGQLVVDVAAAAIHHLDLLKATGTFYTGPPPLPSVVGTDGVGRLEDGRRVFFDSVPPHGSMAERSVAAAGAPIDVPDELDDVTAAALGNSGLAGWLALAWRADLEPGETVLVLGATGQVGTVAVQAAKLLGAGRVVAAARASDRLMRLRDRGADAVVALDGDGDLTESIREAAGGGVNVIVDSLWGDPAVAAMKAAARFCRHVQVGNLAGLDLGLAAPAIRSVSLDVRGFMGLHPPRELRREAYRRLGEHVAHGDIVIELERIPLADVATAWERQRRADAGAKLVLIPKGDP